MACDAPILKKTVPTLSESALSRQLKRLHVFGFIKRVGGTYRYYMTKLGRVAVAAWESLPLCQPLPLLIDRHILHKKCKDLAG